MTAHNLLVSPVGRLVLIDWQYCTFIEPEDPLQLVLQAAQFLRYTDLTESDPGWSE